MFLFLRLPAALQGLGVERPVKGFQRIRPERHAIGAAILALALHGLIELRVQGAYHFDHVLNRQLAPHSQISQLVVCQGTTSFRRLTFGLPLGKMEMVLCQRSFPMQRGWPLFLHHPGNHRFRRDRYMLRSGGNACNMPRSIPPFVVQAPGIRLCAVCRYPGSF